MYSYDRCRCDTPQCCKCCGVSQYSLFLTFSLCVLFAVTSLLYTKSFMAEDEYVAMVERYWQGKTAVLGDKYAQDPLC
jgi:L-rhamnose mutarotase